MAQKTLEQIRKEINEVDDSLAHALVRRAGLAKLVRDVKRETDTQVYHPSRERSILDRVFTICKESGFSQEQVDTVFLSVISACRSIVGDLEIAIPGPLGGMLHAAVIKQFGPVENIVSVSSVSDVVKRIQTAQSPYGIVPVSVDNEGVFNETLFALLSSPVSIAAEICISPRLAVCGSTDEYSRMYVSEDLLPDIEYSLLRSVCGQCCLLPMGAVESLSLEQCAQSSAVLLPEILSHVYPFPIRKDGLRIMSSESMRFFVLGKPDTNTLDHNVQALICVIKDRKGALRSVLEPFEKNDITLLAIESRTSTETSWESVFYIECECKAKRETIEIILKELERICLYVKNVGSFYREAEQRV